MADRIVLWVRAGDADSQAATQFLAAHGYRAETRDAARQPPTEAEWAQLRRGLGGSLAPLVRPDGGAPDDAVLQASPDLWRLPVLLTPRGAVAGFRERRWRDFLDIGKGRS